MRALPISLSVLLLLASIAGAVSPAAVAGAVADPVGEGTESVAGNTEPAAASVAPTVENAADARRRRRGPDRPQVDAGELTFRTLSTPIGVATRVESGSRGANLGSSVGFAVGETDAAMETAAVVQRIEAAETSVERQRRILAAINRVERDEVTLNSRQTEAFSAHAAGNLSDRELLDELVRIAATAREYDERLDELDALAEETDGFSSPTRLDELQVALQVYGVPSATTRSRPRARGATPATDVYVESSNRSIVLATVVDGEYVREVFRVDRWDRGGGSIGNDEAINAVVRRYPETASLREPDAFGAGSVQRITIPHDFGLLRTFVSGGTEQVFVEHQRIALGAFPDTEPVSVNGDGFNVTVDRSYAGGPVTVTVRNEGDRRARLRRHRHEERRRRRQSSDRYHRRGRHGPDALAGGVLPGHRRRRASRRLRRQPPTHLQRRDRSTTSRVSSSPRSQPLTFFPDPAAVATCPSIPMPILPSGPSADRSSAHSRRSPASCCSPSRSCSRAAS